MEKILLPVDGSPESDHAIEEVARLAATDLHVELHLLNVQINGSAQHATCRICTPAALDAAGQAAMASAVAILDEAGAGYYCHVAFGEPARTIVDAARELGCQRIVMGARKAGLAGVVLGSVSTHVIHLADIAVEVIPLSARLAARAL